MFFSHFTRKFCEEMKNIVQFVVWDAEAAAA